ncbi:MAG: urea transporter [Lewinella sp.]|nr:urea transporter [Lewinella sp.]
MTQNTGKLYLTAIANSYSMVFFSLDKWFAAVVLLLTFLDPVVGFAGLLSVLVVNGLALWLGMNQDMVRLGDYGFNALLVGLGLGAFYQLNAPLIALIVFAAVITFFLTVLSLGVLTKYGLSYLSLPFVLALWTLMLASRSFESLGVSERGVYLLNELYSVGDHYLVNTYHYFNELAIPLSLKTYFRSLGAILFQFNTLSGMVLAVALLFYSRIAFSLSLLGFFAAYWFYQLIGADMNALNYNYVGFNFILSAIAVGGFYLVPSVWSYLWALLLIPVLAIVTSSVGMLLAPFGLGVYSLPFNLVVLGFLYVLKWRARPVKPEEVPLQTFSPEKNKYRYLSDQERFRHFRTIPISLPVMGEWFINQGHDGAITHRAEWGQAWDFVLTDEQGKQFAGEGRRLEDYYCYGKPVIAPADGRVAEIMDQIEDNPIGETNLQQNWGNSILIDHGFSLYSQLSHLRPGSIKVNKGDTVKKGQLLAQVGSTGRSPEPHLHFQLQATPYIGAPTLAYPISSYLARPADDGTVFHFFDYPREGELVQNLTPTDQLKYAFYFVPGKTIDWQLDDGRTAHWECLTDPLNQSYIQCRESGAKAYFNNNGAVHYFTGYLGKRGTLLHHFMLANYKVALAYQPGLMVTDVIPIDQLAPASRRWGQDLLSPFLRWMHTHYTLHYDQLDKEMRPEHLALRAEVSLRKGRRNGPTYRYESDIANYRINSFTVEDGKRTIRAKAIDHAPE